MGGSALASSGIGAEVVEGKRLSPPETFPGVKSKRYLLYDRTMEFHRQLVHNLIHDGSVIDRYA